MTYQTLFWAEELFDRARVQLICGGGGGGGGGGVSILPHVKYDSASFLGVSIVYFSWDIKC